MKSFNLTRYEDLRVLKVIQASDLKEAERICEEQELDYKNDNFLEPIEDTIKPTGRNLYSDCKL